MRCFAVRPQADCYEPVSHTHLGPVNGQAVLLVFGSREQAQHVAATLGNAPVPNGFLSHHRALKTRWDVCRFVNLHLGHGATPENSSIPIHRN